MGLDDLERRGTQRNVMLVYGITKGDGSGYNRRV